LLTSKNGTVKNHERNSKQPVYSLKPAYGSKRQEKPSRSFTFIIRVKSALTMKTTFFEVIKHSYIFQVGTVLELSNDIVADGEGYHVPDTGDGSPGTISPENLKSIEDPEDTGPFHGRCILTKVSNYGRQVDKTKIPGEVQPHHVRIVHYPDSQQLYFHMPQYAYNAADFKMSDGVTGEIIEQKPVRDKLNGGTMILLDTLPLKPGFYTVEANWPNGWTHQIKFIKFIAGFPNTDFVAPPNNIEMTLKNRESQLRPVPLTPATKHQFNNIPPDRIEPEKYTHPPGSVSMVQNDLEHKLFDLNGVEIDNGVNTVEAIKNIISRFTRSVTYRQNGRGGTILYKDSENSIAFDWEFGGGNTVAIIFIPEISHWVSATEAPVNQRQEILTFIAEQVVRDQAPSGHYVINSNTILILN
jgi:hypothetical protein